MVKRGIDISSHQGDIDLASLVDNNQIDFVIIRAGYGSHTVDNKFKRNADLCVSLGVPVGFYWYSYALNVQEAETEANLFLDTIAPYTPEYGCWFDMEDADGYKRKHGMPSDDTLQDICYKFCEIVENAGYYSGIYASQSWFRDQLSGNKLTRFDKWIAQWPTRMGKQRGLDTDPSMKNDRSLWQFTSEGRFIGYDGDLDANYAYKEFPNPGRLPITPTPVPAPAVISSKLKYNIGDEVIINGPLYVSSDTKESAGKVINKKTRITRRVEGAMHPYNTEGDLGWMNEENITPVLIKKGAKIKFIGTKTYSGLKLADWTHGDTFNVIEVSGDRIVIGKGSVVTAAVNIKDCELI